MASTTRPSIGIILSAVVALLGSVLALLMGALIIFSFSVVTSELDQQPYAKLGLWVGTGMFIGGGLWGLVTAIGLFRLRNWARVSLLIFSGLLAFFAIIGFLMFLIVPITPPGQVPGPPEGMVRGIFFFFYLAQLVIAALWMVQFTRPSVKGQFLAGVAPVVRRCPLTIAVIAWLLLFGGALLLIPAYLGWPASFFAAILHGWPAILVYLAYAGIDLYVGWGLLKLKPLARKVGIYFQTFALAHILVYTFWPGWEARVQASLNLLPAEMRAGAQVWPLQNQWWFTLIFSVGGPVTILWLLTREKAAFESKPPSSARASG